MPSRVQLADVRLEFARNECNPNTIWVRSQYQILLPILFASLPGCDGRQIVPLLAEDPRV